jgi:hypothetical protein
LGVTPELTAAADWGSSRQRSEVPDVTPGWRLVQDGGVNPIVGPRHKEPWCLATSLKEATATFVVGLYAKRFRTEETFRDVKDLRFGMGLSWVR